MSKFHKSFSFQFSKTYQFFKKSIFLAFKLFFSRTSNTSSLSVFSKFIRKQVFLFSASNQDLQISKSFLL